jgi:23S rRNA pseudouridine2605 synthase
MRTNSGNEPIRLNRYLALLGIGSRRVCDELILSGKILVDGKQVRDPGAKIIPGGNRIKYGSAELDKPFRRIIVLLNKPEGVVTTVSDPMQRKTVLDICRQHRLRMRLFPVGRLDIKTTGAILLTNDGLLCYRLTHPRFQIPKTYHVRVRGMLTDKKIEKLEKLAMPQERHITSDSVQPQVQLLKKLDKGAVIRIVLFEGKNRQVRRICEAVGLRIVKLRRVLFGPISIRKLPLGAIRGLTRKEMDLLDRMISTRR